MSREHELFTELREARLRLRSLTAEEDGARGQLAEATSEWRKSREIAILRANVVGTKEARQRVQETIDEILAEIETGSTGRPILDAVAAAERNGPAEDTAKPAKGAKKR